jgi:hypothetical protein
VAWRATSFPKLGPSDEAVGASPPALRGRSDVPEPHALERIGILARGQLRSSCRSRALSLSPGGGSSLSAEGEANTPGRSFSSGSTAGIVTWTARRRRAYLDRVRTEFEQLSSVERSLPWTSRPSQAAATNDDEMEVVWAHG